MFGATDTLSRCASQILYIHRGDPMDEWAIGQCSELGPLIAKGNRKQELRILEEFGFTPGSYNQELRDRLAPEYPHMSYRTHGLLGILEVEACPQCGGPIEITSHPTRMQGGGYDTFEKCPECGYSEVYV